jgi:signal transduction histidine kinase
VSERKTAEQERESLLASERAARAQADEAVRLREQLLGILGHDLRNPLSAIILAAKLLLRSTELVAADRRKVERLLTSSERMSRLISQILDFSRARIGGGLTVRRVETNLQLVCQEAIDELQMAAPDRNILLEAPAGEIIGQWNRDRLLEVLSNLVGNAVQHGDPSSSVKVRVGSNENQAWIEIHNRGEPIPLEVLPEIFDPYRRGPQEAMSGSVGLGLYISQQIVLAHHGEIEVTSERETGTLFRVRLPLREPTSQ